MNVSETEQRRRMAMRSGAASYWLSEVAWQSLRAQGRADGHNTVRGYIEASYREWTSRDLSIEDSALQDLIAAREAIGKGGPRDHVVVRAWYDGYQRWPHTLDLSVGALNALSAWAIAWRIPHRMTVPQPRGLAAIALECVGRGWLK